MSKEIIIIGFGGHAKVLIDTLLLLNCHIRGAIDSDEKKLGHEFMGVKVMGSDSYLKDISPDSVKLVNAIGSTSNTKLRKNIFLNYKEMGFEFLSVIHPGAIVSQTATIGEGSQILAGAVIGPDVRVGKNSIINTRASVDHDCVVGESSHVAPGVVLSGGVQVGSSSHIGTGASIIESVIVESDVFVAAGSVVVKKIESHKKVRGIPAKGY